MPRPRYRKRARPCGRAYYPGPWSRASVPEVARSLRVLLGERLDRLEGLTCRQALALELLQLCLGDFHADLAKARVLLRREPDRLRAAVDERLLAHVVERVPACADLFLHALHRVVDQLLQVGRELGVKVRVHADAEGRDIAVDFGRVLDGPAHLEGDARAAVVGERAVDPALLQLLELLARLHADGRAAELRDELA